MSPLNAEEATSSTNLTNVEEVDIMQTIKDMSEQDKKTLGLEKFALGKKYLACANLEQAIKCLSDATAIYACVYGELSAECGPVYFEYGMATLDLARLEPGVFSNALQGMEADETVDEVDETIEEGDETSAIENNKGQDIGEKNGQEKTPKEGEEDKFEDPDKLTDDEREDIHAAVEIALAENADALKEGKVPDEPTAEEREGEDDPVEEETTKEEETVIEGKQEEVEGAKEGENAIVEQGKEGENAVVEQGKEGENVVEEGKEEECGEEDIDDEDVSSIQRAYELFETCRIICEKQEGVDWRRRLCSTLLALGECQIEDESFDKAARDLVSCMEIQKKEFPEEERAIAETLFQLGRAYNLWTKFDEATEVFKESVKLLESRIAKCKICLESSEDKEKVQKEIDDLEKLVPEINTKVEDCMASKTQADQMEKEKAEAPAPTTGFIEPKDDAPATDISSMVRKPLKRENETLAEGVTKKSKVDEDVENVKEINTNDKVETTAQ